MTVGSSGPAVVGPSGHDGPHVFVDDLERPDLSETDRHHVIRVLRVRPGESLTISDGQGRWRVARMTDRHEIEAAGPVETVPRAEPTLTVAFAVVKGDRPELIVQKSTELGIDRLVPFVADRSVVRWDARQAERHVERLRRVAREASMQSRRCYLPEVAPLATFADVVSLDGAAAAERSGPPLSETVTAILVGPEGGWSDGERRKLGPTVGLGDHILRAETAALAAATLLTAMRAGTIEPVVRTRPADR